MSDVMETIRKRLCDKGMRPEAATAAAQAASKTIKGSTAYYMSLLRLAEESEDDNERIQTGCRR